ncbi:MAG TPA: leucyl aminopeptidase [Thermoanaerobaculia bacterium]|nr:leucyl aminopeptidase [Thermoanaerobaculia bacterium]
MDEDQALQLGLFSGKARKGDLIVIGALEGEPPNLDGLPGEVAAAAVRWPRGSGSADLLVDLGLTTSGAAIAGRELGKRDALDSRKVAQFARAAVEAAVERRSRRLILAPPAHQLTSRDEGRELSLIAAAAATYRYGKYLEAKDEARLRWIGLARSGDRATLDVSVAAARAVASGARIARDLANTPPNIATPAWMAGEVRSLARRFGGQVVVLGPRELERRRMGGLLAVGSGSKNPPRLVRWRLGSRGSKIGLVGKGVTFDTGGISIKPAAAMHEMKYDKCGACAVIGTMVAAAQLGVAARLEAYLPLAENMPDAAAYRPGDIVRCADGTTVEITNTDAEGRMILADTLVWAAQAKPQHLVELSTLTGATVVALGTVGAALYTPDDELARTLLGAAERSHERLWRMPMWPEFVEEMKGNHADWKNAGERAGGANAAAAFLGHFARGAASWAHLDIAGTAYSAKPVSRAQSGATGYGVALLTRWLRDRARPVES